MTQSPARPDHPLDAAAAASLPPMPAPLIAPPAGGRAAPGTIFVCFFGITRALSHTITSIRDNIITPAGRVGPVRIHAHLFRQDRVDNPRSRESGEMDPEEYRLLGADWLAMEPPGDCLDARGFDAICSHGDAFRDDFRSMRNLVHQLHSLDIVARSALDAGAEICIFARPDLTYHDPMGRQIVRAASAARRGRSLAVLPWWQGWHGGLNDRFALCAGRAAIAAYGQRIRAATSFCEATKGALHAERLVRFVLDDAGVAIRTTGLRASRTRLGGHVQKERFTHPLQDRIERKLNGGALRQN